MWKTGKYVPVVAPLSFCSRYLPVSGIAYADINKSNAEGRHTIGFQLKVVAQPVVALTIWYSS